MSFIPNSDTLLEIQKGNVPGHEMWEVIGERGAIGTGATGEDMWMGAATHIPKADSLGEQMTVVSTSTDDTHAGTGTRSITICYINVSGEAKEETILMSGTTGVNTIATDVVHVNTFHTSTTGSGVSAGDITVHKAGTPDVVYSIIKAGGNMDLTCQYMVPGGHKLCLLGWHAEVSSNDRVSIRLRSTDNKGVLIPGVYLFKGVSYLAKFSSGDMPLRATIPGLSVLKISAFADQNDADASTSCYGVLVKDGY